MTDGEVFSSNYAKLRAPEIPKPLKLPTFSDEDFQGEDVLHIVWFKRDLRICDHEVLHRVSAYNGRVLLLYILEPELWKGRDTSERQFLFLQESVIDLQEQVREQFGDHFVVVRVGEAVSILENIVSDRRFEKYVLWSHQETWNLWTYKRDKQVRRWCHEMGITWREPSQNGVVRNLQSRNGWAEKWQERMSSTRFLKAPSIASHRFWKLQTHTWPGSKAHSLPHDMPSMDVSTWWTADEGKRLPCPGRQRGGREIALYLMNTFLYRRGQWYQKEMSSPITAWESCSRLSSHLAFGTLSLREAFQRVESRRAEILSMSESTRPPGWALSLQAMSSRLRWHCHFIQKLEDEPELEYRNMHPAYDGLRTERIEDMSVEEKSKLQAWKSGTTGYTIVDAVMRALISTGWVNFRMRAMLVSFASFHLFLHWREPALWMAKMFVDYEPGIHFCQFQMQAGTTGMNTIRCYSPHKQAYDQDPDGIFIRRWVKELQHMPKQWIHEPHLTQLCPTRARHQTKNNRNSKAALASRGKCLDAPSLCEYERDRIALGVHRAYMIDTATDAKSQGKVANVATPQTSIPREVHDIDNNQYAKPIVDEKAARQFALDKIFAVRREKESIETNKHVAVKHGSRRLQSEENPERFGLHAGGALKGFGENLEKKRPPAKSCRRGDRGPALLAGQAKLHFPSHSQAILDSSSAATSTCRTSNEKTSTCNKRPSLLDFFNAPASSKRRRIDRTVEDDLLHDGATSNNQEIFTIDLLSDSDVDNNTELEIINLVSTDCGPIDECQNIIVHYS